MQMPQCESQEISQRVRTTGLLQALCIPPQCHFRSLNAPSLNAVHRSIALPVASSVLLLKLLPKEGPTWDFASIAASKPFLTTNKSHYLVGRKNPGNSNAFFRNMNPTSIPDSKINLVKRLIKPSI